VKKSVTLNFEVIEDRKVKAKSTLIVDLLKKRGIPASMALNYYRNYGGEYLVRKTFLLDYFSEKEKVKSEMRWLMSAIANDYSEPEHFLNWWERKKEYILNSKADGKSNGNADLKQLLSI